MISLKNIIFFFLITFLTLAIPSCLWARAGGGGGGGGSHSGGGSSSGGIFFGSHRNSSSSDNSTVIFFIFILLLIFLILNIRRKIKSINLLKSTFENNTLDAQELSEIIKKINLAFHIIQESWSLKKIDLMRRFITDGVYQRYNAQFTMMNLLDQVNIISKIEIKNISVKDPYSDGNYDVIEARISAFAADQFVSETYPELNSPGGEENFIEIWSFIRRKDYKKGFDIYHSELCPTCSAPLQSKLQASAQCPYCSTYLNNGEYDWVLSEITQLNDYKETTSPQLLPINITQHLPDYCRQLIEDRASSAFMQILIACALENDEPLAHFTTPKAMVNLKKFLKEKSFCYERLFLNSVDAGHCFIKDSHCYVAVDICFSSRRVQTYNKTAMLLDQEIVKQSVQLILVHEIGNDNPRLGSIFANTCSHCGAAQKDNLLLVCTNCNQVLNNTRGEWLVDQITNNMRENGDILNAVEDVIETILSSNRK